MTNLEKSEIEVLEYTKQAALPAPLKDNNVFWLDAIALVRKNDASRNYAVASYDGHDVRIKKDFGSDAQIVSVEQLYPYNVISKKYIPKLTSDEKIKSYMINYGVKPEDAERYLTTDRETGKRVLDKIIIENARKLAEEDNRGKRYLDSK